MKRSRWILGIGTVLAVVFGFAWTVWTRPHLPPAERGRRLAASTGCFTCHGPGGNQGAPNPGRPFPEVPGFAGDLMMYAKNETEIREWIRDGVPRTRAESKSWQEERDAGVLIMPAFGDRLSESEIDDLVAYVQALGAAPVPEDSLARRGRDRAESLGCFGCHGPGGRFAPPNPGSLKGAIPSWDGEDFPELVRGREEFSEWVRFGISRRFEKNPFARFFLERAAIHMPAYEEHLEPKDVDALWAYVSWLRSQSS